MIAPGCDPPVTAATTPAYVGGVLTGCIAPTTVGAMSTVGNPVRPIIGCGIAAITGCSVTSEGIH